MIGTVCRVKAATGVRGTWLTPIWLAGGLLLAAAPARAQVSTTYDVHACRASSYLEETSVYRGYSGFLKNVGPNPVWVACPITRRTSGPGVTNDALSSVTVPASGNDYDVYCQVEFWSSKVDTDPYSGHWANSWGWDDSYNYVSNGNNVVIPANYYTGNWDIGGGQWLYSTLTCQVQPGAGMSNYTVLENGTDHKYRIYSALSCGMDSSNNMMNYADPAGFDGDGLIPPGGILRGQAGQSITNPPAQANKFAARCPMFDNVTPNNVFNNDNRRIEFSMSRTAATYPIGCNLDNANLSTLQWQGTPNTNGSVWPSQTLPSSTSPFIAIPSTGQHNLICGVNGTLGDPKLLSYRSSPSPERLSWVATSNPVITSDPPKNALDDSSTSRWTTHAVGASGNWYQVDFGSAKSWSQVTMDSTTSNDYARGYRIDVSNDGQHWSQVATGTGTSPFITKKLSQQLSRYVRITLTGGIPNGSWWSLAELNIY